MNKKIEFKNKIIQQLKNTTFICCFFNYFLKMTYIYNRENHGGV